MSTNLAISGHPETRNSDQKLTIEFLGEFSVAFRGVNIHIASAKGRALLAILALSGNGQVSREKIRGLLWSDSTEKRAQFSLRNLVRGLNSHFQAAGFKGFVATRQTLNLSFELIKTDVTEILRSCQAGAPLERLCADPEVFDRFLYGYEDLDEALNDWVRARRIRLKTASLDHLETALADKTINDHQQQNIAKIILRHNPSHETAFQALISAYDRLGDKANALAAYQTFWEYLDEQFGEEPSDQTQRLIVDIKSRASDISNTMDDASQWALLDDPTNANERLPFALQNAKPAILVSILDLSGVADGRQHIIRGLRQDLIACLVRFREWYVLDAEDVDISSVTTQAPQCNYRLTISTFDTADVCRVTINFKDIVTGLGIWSQRFELEFENWINLQNIIVRRIAVALNLHLSAERVSEINRRPKAKLAAYDHWLKGQELIHDYQPKSWEMAGVLFEKINQTHPDFSRAYSSLAEMENLRHIQFPGVHSDDASRARGLEYARSAVKLDPLDSRSQLSLGWSCAMGGKFERAELAFSLAHENNENDPWTLVSAAVGLAFCDQVEASRELATLALSLDISPSKVHWSYQAVIFFLNGEYDKCIWACEQAQDISADVPAWHAAALAISGQDALASTRLEQFFKLAKKQWAVAERPTEQDIATWLLRCYPIRNQNSLSRFAEGLRRAGLKNAELTTPQPVPVTSGY